MQTRTLALLVLFFGGLSLFLFGIVAAPLLGLIPPRSLAGHPAATISLDLAGQVAALQDERAQVSAALARSLRELEGLEDRLAVAEAAADRSPEPAGDTAFEAPENAAEDSARDTPPDRAPDPALTAALAAAELRAEAVGQQVASLRAERNMLRADLATAAAERDALQAGLAGYERDIAGLIRRAEQAEASLGEALQAEVAPAPGAMKASVPASVPAPVPAGPDAPDVEAGPVIAPSGDTATALEGGSSPVPIPVPAPAPDSAVADGIAAYRAGDYATAFALWQPLAAAGDARAQFHLGALYYEGRGVRRDLAAARQWLSVAAAGGSRQAANLLDAIENAR